MTSDSNHIEVLKDENVKNARISVIILRDVEVTQDDGRTCFEKVSL
jgi:hypothetical protein